MQLATHFNGCTMEAVWDRQLRIEGWKQDQLTAAVALCLGVRATGSAVAMGLCRMGVGRILLVDNEVVEVTDLPSSPLFASADVGRNKVEAAVTGLQPHNIVSEIEAHHFDYLQDWQQLVSLATRSTIIFHTVSAGDLCDLAVQSLALKLGIPLVQAGSLASFQLVDCYSGQGKPCMNCSSEGIDPAEVQALAPATITTLVSIKDKVPAGLTDPPLTIVTAGIAGMLMVAQLGNMVIADPQLQVVPRFILSSSTMEAIKFPIPPNESCLFCTGR